MAHLLESVGRRRPDPARGAFGQHHIWKPRLDGAVALPERVILRIRDLGLVLFVVAPVVVGDEFGKFLELREGFLLGQAFDGHIEKRASLLFHFHHL